MQKVTFKEETYQLEGKALKVGDKAPDVKLVNGDLKIDRYENFMDFKGFFKIETTF
ncbi:hypothetical protein JP0547_13290 [Helicobacter pylori]